MIEVGIHTGERDIEKLINYCQKLDINAVCMHCQAIDGYQENGVPDKAHLMTVQDSMMRAGKKVKVMISTPLQIDVLSKVDEWESKVDEVCGTFEVLGACGVEAVLLFNFMKAAEASEREEQWQLVSNIYRRFTEQAEKSGVKIATHGHCLPEYLIWNFDSISRLLQASDSPFNGWTYDPGILLLAQDDPYETVEKVKGRIPFAHARDVLGDWRMWDEVFLGRGNVDFPKVLQLLQDADFDGLICPEHLGPDGQGRENREAMAVKLLKEQLGTK